jgi:hypothetical protein
LIPKGFLKHFGSLFKDSDHISKGSERISKACGKDFEIVFVISKAF